MPHPRNPFLLTLPEAALFLEVKPTRVRYLVDLGELPLHRHGARVYVHVEDLRHLRSRLENRPAQGPAVRILQMLGHRMRVIFWWGNGHERADRPPPPAPASEGPQQGGERDAP